jgi:hypothetical protein
LRRLVKHGRHPADENVATDLVLVQRDPRVTRCDVVDVEEALGFGLRSSVPYRLVGVENNNRPPEGSAGPVTGSGSRRPDCRSAVARTDTSRLTASTRLSKRFGGVRSADRSDPCGSSAFACGRHHAIACAIRRPTDSASPWPISRPASRSWPTLRR